MDLRCFDPTGIHTVVDMKESKVKERRREGMKEGTHVNMTQ